MASSQMRPLSETDVAARIQRFGRYLRCSGLGIRFGSKLYFDMGPRFERRITPNSTRQVGTSTLVLEGYDWVILDHGRTIARASAITTQHARELEEKFIGSLLQSMTWHKELQIEFSGDLHVWSKPIFNDDYSDDKLLLWVLPDGEVIGCDARIGFYSDGSVSQPHAKHYAELAA